MPALKINKSILINAPHSKVHETITDFHHWTAWSPWLIQEPEAKVKVDSNGKYYEWNGDRIGSGNMKVVSDSNNHIDYDLHFLKPWKSTSKVAFDLEEKDGGTKVTWTMDSSLPWFMFWMKKMMTAFVGNDYYRGLLMLKDYVESGSVKSRLEFEGEGQYPGCTYVGIPCKCNLEEAPQKMEANYGRLFAELAPHEDKMEKDAFTIYHNWDFVKGKAEFISCQAVSELPAGLPSDFIKGTIPSTKTYSINHLGSYHHLGNAWSTMYNLHRAKVFKPRKDLKPFEIYISDPKETPEEDIITKVVFPVK